VPQIKKREINKNNNKNNNKETTSNEVKIRICGYITCITNHFNTVIGNVTINENNKKSVTMKNEKNIKNT
jgi:hypothetical protein